MFRIGDLEISGKVSLKYLVPREEVFLRKASEGIFLPIIILLGDKHFEDSGRRLGCAEDSYPVDFFLRRTKAIRWHYADARFWKEPALEAEVVQVFLLLIFADITIPRVI